MPVNSRLSPFAISLMLALASIHSHAEEEKHEDSPLEEINVTASADASAEGLVKSYAGRQVAKGARIGLLGNKEIMDTPFSFNAYTNELIQDQQAKSVGDVLLNDPSVRVARGYGNFQESYYIRGFILGSDSVAYNGLYGLLPRQYISAELFERVEVLRGASAFLTGTNPNGDGIGGAISLLPKRAPNEPINRVTLGWSRGDQGLVSADFARRFGPDERMGIRLNVTQRRGGTGIDDEHVELGLASIGLDWRGDQTRISADLGYQDNKLRETRTNVTLADNITTVPRAPKSSKNWAQPWSYSNERDWMRPSSA
ncbi:TonB-dependent receptor plug domain-containing protein [Methylobacillus sp. Pita1]|uniref:TonB-dependent receptor plug domain-containing protein n=1 Tax=Methylobacillus sp. Pita1 TaxID=3382642 RepID=UPI0038B5BBCD